MTRNLTNRKPNWPKLEPGQGAILTKRNGDQVKFIRPKVSYSRSKYTHGPKPVVLSLPEPVLTNTPMPKLALEVVQ